MAAGHYGSGMKRFASLEVVMPSCFDSQTVFNNATPARQPGVQCCRCMCNEIELDELLGDLPDDPDERVAAPPTADPTSAFEIVPQRATHWHGSDLTRQE